MKRKGQKKKLRLKVIITTDIILLVILCGALLAKGLYKSNKEEPQPETKTESANKEGQKPENRRHLRYRKQQLPSVQRVTALWERMKALTTKEALRENMMQCRTLHISSKMYSLFLRRMI